MFKSFGPTIDFLSIQHFSPKKHNYFFKTPKNFSDVLCITLIEQFLEIEMKFFGRVVKIAFCLAIEKFGTEFFLKNKNPVNFFNFA